MGKLSKKLRSLEGGALSFWCPGCKRAHTIYRGDGVGPRWGYNWNADKPTFTPSVLVSGRDFTPAGYAAYERWYEAGCSKPAPQFESADTVCHSFVTDGLIQFLGDSTHELAGQTVELPDWPEGVE